LDIGAGAYYSLLMTTCKKMANNEKVKIYFAGKHSNLNNFPDYSCETYELKNIS
jgi:hypothetical protein